MQLRAGDPETIGGYTIQERLGAGGMGTVFLALSPSGRRVALKLIHTQFLHDEEFRTRFRQEVAAARRVSGAFTAAVVDADPDGDHPWMATTYIAGPTLAQRITEQGPLHGNELRTLAIGLVEALRDIHRAGVIHRDLKPSNVVLSQDGPRVIDFGISRATDHQTLTMTGRMIGTPPFMSPEQLQSPRQVGTESDVFSVATVLVYAATGQGPFHADSPYISAYQVVHRAPELSRVPEPLRAVVEPCLAKDPGARPTADELLRQLSALPADLFPPVQDQTAPSRPKRANRLRRSEHPPSSTGGRRRRWPLVLAVALAVAALSTGVTLLAGGRLPSTIGGGAAGDQGVSVAAPQPPPSGFHPWQRTVSGGYEFKDELRCVPHGDSVYCGGGGVLAVRIRIKDGTQVWKRPSEGVPRDGLYFVGVAGDTVIGYRIASTGSEEIVALAAANGRELWSRGIADNTSWLTGDTVETALVGDTVFSVDRDRTRIEARNTDTGTLRWSRPFPAGSMCAPVAAGVHAYAMCGPTAELDDTAATHPSFRTLDPGTGQLGRPMQAEGQLLPVGAANDGSLVALRRRAGPDGQDGYTHVLRLNPRSGQVRSTPLHGTGPACGMAGGTLYCSGENGLVRAVDPATGKKRWQTQTDLETPTSPVLSHGMLYLSTLSGRVVAIDDRSGRLKWSTTPRAKALGDAATVPPRLVVTQGVVVVSADENVLFGIAAARHPKGP